MSDEDKMLVNFVSVLEGKEKRILSIDEIDLNELKNFVTLPDQYSDQVSFDDIIQNKI